MQLPDLTERDARRRSLQLVWAVLSAIEFFQLHNQFVGAAFGAGVFLSVAADLYEQYIR